MDQDIYEIEQDILSIIDDEEMEDSEKLDAIREYLEYLY